MPATAYLHFSRIAVRLLSVAAMVLIAGGARAQVQAAPVGPCGDPFHNHFGPFDYRTAPMDIRGMVERPHFPPGVETMTKPSKTTYHYMAQDVAYTLHVFPNHHRALNTMMRLGERHKTDPAPGARYTVECYFVRGMQYKPDDTVVRSLYALFLTKQKRNDDAVRQLELASEYAKDNPLSHLNIGLLYFDLGRYDRALEAAHAALALGFTRTDLIDKLKGINKWTEPGQLSAAPDTPKPNE
ncbi:tetratricopeptide repeat protein [Aquabacterium sp.]|uniref:tetratricopeptide repeat protein n=1 Tax=Aquabacterium sp. TaxID=1872578 RepID=UPI002C0C0E83|nr:hypothetical protein [Aquabacterium sp.]HSW03488.1 hypothetical protein [Aquabacterium sp.]